MSDNEILQEDDSSAWWHQLDLEARQAQERELTPEVRDVIEMLDRSAAMLASIPEVNYPVIADLRRRLQIERRFILCDAPNPKTSQAIFLKGSRNKNPAHRPLKIRFLVHHRVVFLRSKNTI